MNIFIREIKANFKSFLVWSGAMIFLIAAGMMKYTAFAKTGQAVNDMFAQIPAQLLKVMGIDSGFDLSSVSVFYSIFFLYFILLTAVHSCLLGVNIIAKEERDKTADFLLVKPIRRFRAIAAKTLAALLMVVLYNQVTFAFSVYFVERNNNGPPLTRSIFYLTTALLVIQVLFLSIGLLLGGWARNAARASGLATLIILGTFMLKVLIDLQEELDYLDFLTPFRYFDSGDVLFSHRIDPVYVVLSLTVSLLSVAGACLFFQRRDLRC